MTYKRPEKEHELEQALEKKDKRESLLTACLLIILSFQTPAISFFSEIVLT